MILIELLKNIDPKRLKTELEKRLSVINTFTPKLNICVEF